MTIHLLVEGPSERALMEVWAPRLIKDHAIRVYPHQGKGSLPADATARPDPKRRGLLDQLPAKLRGFAQSSTPEADLVVVLVDADDDDPMTLSKSIAEMAKSVSPRLAVLVRLAVEETEAFYLGDLHALKQAFPDADMKAAAEYQPDSICGTWELVGRIIGDGGGNKVSWAEAMGPVLTTRAAASRSPSFRKFVQGLLGYRVEDTPEKKRKYRHPTKRPSGSGRRGVRSR